MLKNRKSFTLVELLVVIAIIAILATVSTLTYTSFIKKSNNSNDIVLVKQMNDTLDAYQVNHNVENATDVCIALKQAGVLNKLTPATENKRFAWNIETKQIELVDLKVNETYISIEYHVTEQEVETEEIDFEDLG